jgi:hypothetical protein
LLQQQGGSGAVEGAAAVAMEPMQLGRGPTAGVFVNPGQGQRQGPGQAFAIAAAMEGLLSGLLLGIEGQAHHQGQHPPLAHQPFDLLQVVWEAAAA